MRIPIAIALLSGVIFSAYHSPANAQSCLAAPIMSTAGERVMSPYGVDRSSRPGASNGYHQGLDIVNSSGRGDPILAGIHGTVFVAKDGSGGKKVGITSSDGKQRFIFFHLDGYNVRVGQAVTPTTVIGIQGSTGVSYTAVHLHLSALLKGSVLRSAGNSGGKVWRSAHGWVGTKTSSPLAISEIHSASPESYYFVNPEPFLHHRIPMALPMAYVQQGLKRPDGLTLPTTCAPSDEFFDRSGIHSSNGGVSGMDGLQADLGVGGVSEAVERALQETKEAFITMAQSAAGRQAGVNAGLETTPYRTATWAGLTAAINH